MTRCASPGHGPRFPCSGGGPRHREPFRDLDTALDRILPGMELKWEMENKIPFFLRSVLRHQGEALPTLGTADCEQAGMRTSEGSTDIRSQLGMRRFTGPH